MKIDLSDIARGRRIVAVTARQMALTRQARRPARRSILQRLLRRILGPAWKA